jgi:predicted lipase
MNVYDEQHKQYNDLQSYNLMKHLINDVKAQQVLLDETKTMHNTINNTEDIIRKKISLREKEIEALKKDFNNILETYNHIIKLFVI